MEILRLFFLLSYKNRNKKKIERKFVNVRFRLLISSKRAESVALCSFNCKVTQTLSSIINVSVGKQMTSTSLEALDFNRENFYFSSIFHLALRDDDDFRFRYLLIISIITHRIKCMYVLELEGRHIGMMMRRERKICVRCDGGIYGIKFLSNAINRAKIWDREWAFEEYFNMKMMSHFIV